VKVAKNQLYSDSIRVKGSDSDSCIKMMEANTRTIVEGLGGKYTPFVLKGASSFGRKTQIASKPLRSAQRMKRIW
jgi:manganese/iron transport system substrate-binding protein